MSIRARGRRADDCARRLDDHGSAAVETAIIAPALILLLLVIAAFGRVHLAQGKADSAARAAARTASLARDPATAQQQARQAAMDSLDADGLRCSDVTIHVDTSGLSAPIGQSATVTATVACTAPLGDLAVPGLPGSKQLTSSFTSVVDQYRARPDGAA
ncbi:pilus assembly protein [Streptomyces antimycoticus]|uniref:Membrane protein n=1 Tax=Streptomyces antimycoticus TaxID=68175 RepID=A0A4D4KQP9_9ACTN|nr:TadE/TadG family type IV pilus assembly protein [Streptomyces antimycoticus]GDY49236.1 membrane protein [Streptomyces antimycoticus]